MSGERQLEAVTLITGTSRGIGAFLARRYLSRGHRVYGCSRNDAGIDDPQYRHAMLDITDERAVRRLFSRIREESGMLDNLINNAGIASMNHAMLTPLDTVRRILDTNVAGTFLFCREAAKLMQNRGRGRIVNFVSVASPLRLEGEAVYAASKSAVRSLTEIFAREFAELGITVNAIGPTPIRTDLIRGVPEERLEALLSRQAIPRFGTFEDVANVVDFYLSEASSFVTAQTLYLGGVV